MGLELPISRYRADKAGLVSDELMLDVVKTELDRLRGKVGYEARVLKRGQLMSL